MVRRRRLSSAGPRQGVRGVFGGVELHPRVRFTVKVTARQWWRDDGTGRRGVLEGRVGGQRSLYGVCL